MPMQEVDAMKNALSSDAQELSRNAESPLSEQELALMNAYWRACNYLSVGMIYLKDNPLLKEPLRTEQIKHRLLGHWGASPALSFVWVHLNRVIVKHDLDIVFVAGPGHGAPGVLGPAYLEGTYSEIYPDKSEDEEGMRKFFRQFSFPGQIGSHVTPETPGSIHEGGELGYSLSHAYGMAFDNPDLIVACVIGDGEAETGPLATAWHSNKFLNPARDGAVLPILNLNGYKIANPSILSRISHEELNALLVGYGYTPYFVEGHDPAQMHQKMAATLEQVVVEIRATQKAAQGVKTPSRPRWPMIVLRSPKGWTGPKEIRGHKVEGFWRSHQVPCSDVRDNPESLQLLEDWMRSYRPEDLFDSTGALVPELRALAPKGHRRMSANPHANGGLLRKELELPDFRKYAVHVPVRGGVEHENTKSLGEYLRDVMRLNPTSYRVFGHDENASNRLQAL
jgi:xylulose-5-phosphate/fructose-6-phosphate phosphoketolase